jgi:hypothetical protein
MNPPLQGLGDNGGLFENLLQHIVLIGALIHLRRGEAGLLYRTLHRRALVVEYGDAVPPHLGHIPLFQENEPVGDRQQGKHVRGDKILLLSDPQHQRAAGAGHHDPLPIAGAHHRQGIGPYQLRGGGTHRLQEIAVGTQLFVQQVGDYLGIGL